MKYEDMIVKNHVGHHKSAVQIAKEKSIVFAAIQKCGEIASFSNVLRVIGEDKMRYRDMQLRIRDLRRAGFIIYDRNAGIYKPTGKMPNDIGNI